MESTFDDPIDLSGKLLIAMPQLQDPWFNRSLVYLCLHSDEGAMGLVINKTIDSVTFTDLLDQLGVDKGPGAVRPTVHFGGPVETSRGFVLHTSDYLQSSSLEVGKRLALTATLDVLRAISDDHGPRHSLVALGYAGWGPNQLEDEIQDNSWLVLDPDEDILFNTDPEQQWNLAISRLGFDPSHLSGEAGHA